MKTRWFIFGMVLMTMVLAACSGGANNVNVATPEATTAVEAPAVTEAAATEPMATEAVVTEAPAITEAVATEAPAATESSVAAGAVTCANNVDQAALLSAGQELYTTRCAACHGPAGEGMGSFPALANNPDLTEDDLTNAAAKFFDPKNHPFLTELNSTDIAAAFSFARASFGNQAQAVCPELIDQLMP